MKREGNEKRSSERGQSSGPTSQNVGNLGASDVLSALQAAPHATLDRDRISVVGTDIRHIGKIPPQISTPIRSLFLSNNRLPSLDGVEQFPNVKILAAANNGIRHFEDIQSLISLKDIRKLSLGGNPITWLPYYRDYVLCLCPTLETLDGVRVASSYGNTTPTQGTSGSLIAAASSVDHAQARLNYRKLLSFMGRAIVGVIRNDLVSHVWLRRKCHLELQNSVFGRLVFLRSAYIDTLPTVTPSSLSRTLHILRSGGVFDWVHTMDELFLSQTIQNSLFKMSSQQRRENNRSTLTEVTMTSSQSSTGVSSLRVSSEEATFQRYLSAQETEWTNLLERLETSHVDLSPTDPEMRWEYVRDEISRACMFPVPRLQLDVAPHTKVAHEAVAGRLLRNNNWRRQSNHQPDHREMSLPPPPPPDEMSSIPPPAAPGVQQTSRLNTQQLPSEDAIRSALRKSIQSANLGVQRQQLGEEYARLLALPQDKLAQIVANLDPPPASSVRNVSNKDMNGISSSETWRNGCERADILSSHMLPSQQLDPDTLESFLMGGGSLPNSRNPSPAPLREYQPISHHSVSHSLDTNLDVRASGSGKDDNNILFQQSPENQFHPEALLQTNFSHCIPVSQQEVDQFLSTSDLFSQNPEEFLQSSIPKHLESHLLEADTAMRRVLASIDMSSHTSFQPPQLRQDAAAILAGSRQVSVAEVKNLVAQLAKQVVLVQRAEYEACTVNQSLHSVVQRLLTLIGESVSRSRKEVTAEHDKVYAAYSTVARIGKHVSQVTSGIDNVDRLREEVRKGEEANGELAEVIVRIQHDTVEERKVINELRDRIGRTDLAIQALKTECTRYEHQLPASVRRRLVSGSKEVLNIHEGVVRLVSLQRKVFLAWREMIRDTRWKRRLIAIRSEERKKNCLLSSFSTWRHFVATNRRGELLSRYLRIRHLRRVWLWMKHLRRRERHIAALSIRRRRRQLSYGLQCWLRYHTQLRVAQQTSVQQSLFVVSFFAVRIFRAWKQYTLDRRKWYSDSIQHVHTVRSVFLFRRWRMALIQKNKDTSAKLAAIKEFQSLNRQESSWRAWKQAFAIRKRLLAVLSLRHGWRMFTSRIRNIIRYRLKFSTLQQSRKRHLLEDVSPGWSWRVEKHISLRRRLLINTAFGNWLRCCSECVVQKASMYRSIRFLLWKSLKLWRQSVIRRRLKYHRLKQVSSIVSQQTRVRLARGALRRWISRWLLSTHSAPIVKPGQQIRSRLAERRMNTLVTNIPTVSPVTTTTEKAPLAPTIPLKKPMELVVQAPNITLPFIQFNAISATKHLEERFKKLPRIQCSHSHENLVLSSHPSIFSLSSIFLIWRNYSNQQRSLRKRSSVLQQSILHHSLQKYFSMWKTTQSRHLWMKLSSLRKHSASLAQESNELQIASDHERANLRETLASLTRNFERQTLELADLEDSNIMTKLQIRDLEASSAVYIATKERLISDVSDVSLTIRNIELSMEQTAALLPPVSNSSIEDKIEEDAELTSLKSEIEVLRLENRAIETKITADQRVLSEIREEIYAAHIEFERLQTLDSELDTQLEELNSIRSQLLQLLDSAQNLLTGAYERITEEMDHSDRELTLLEQEKSACLELITFCEAEEERCRRFIDSKKQSHGGTTSRSSAFALPPV